jgi:hypothetical protein
VILSEGARDAATRAAHAGDSLWRISSTVFAHINSDCILEPVLQSDDDEEREHGWQQSFPPVQAGTFVAAELEKIFAANSPESGNSSKL